MCSRMLRVAKYHGIYHYSHSYNVEEVYASSHRHLCAVRLPPLSEKGMLCACVFHLYACAVSASMCSRVGPLSLRDPVFLARLSNAGRHFGFVKHGTSLISFTASRGKSVRYVCTYPKALTLLLLSGYVIKV